jgi:hypothetical protein
MGALVNVFQCSVCGKVDNMDEHSCTHMKEKGSLWGEKQTLAYQACVGTMYYETSWIPKRISSPADPTAYSPDIYS